MPLSPISFPALRLKTALAFSALALSGCQHPTSNERVAEPAKTVVGKGDEPQQPSTRKFSPTRFPVIDVAENTAAVDRVRRDPVGSQPWMQGALTPPTSVTDLGLKGRLSLEALAGGTVEWGVYVVISDGRGNLF